MIWLYIYISLSHCNHQTTIPFESFGCTIPANIERWSHRTLQCSPWLKSVEEFEVKIHWNTLTIINHHISSYIIINHHISSLIIINHHISSLIIINHHWPTQLDVFITWPLQFLAKKNGWVRCRPWGSRRVWSSSMASLRFASRSFGCGVVRRCVFFRIEEMVVKSTRIVGTLGSYIDFIYTYKKL